jgi:DNA-directed RNA polymerase specialized sigma24 family protein
MDDDQLAARFEGERPRLLAVATRMLGSTVEAQDAVQEAWLRLERTTRAARRGERTGSMSSAPG